MTKTKVKKGDVLIMKSGYASDKATIAPGAKVIAGHHIDVKECQQLLDGKYIDFAPLPEKKPKTEQAKPDSGKDNLSDKQAKALDEIEKKNEQ